MLLPHLSERGRLRNYDSVTMRMAFPVSSTIKPPFSSAVLLLLADCYTPVPSRCRRVDIAWRGPLLANKVEDRRSRRSGFANRMVEELIGSGRLRRIRPHRLGPIGLSRAHCCAWTKP